MTINHAEKTAIARLAAAQAKIQSNGGAKKLA